jgi:Peptidase M15
LQINDFLKSPIGEAKDFTWSEALFLPQWKIHCIPDNEQILKNIERTAEKMQLIREIFGQKIRVTSWFRPEKYNETIKGAKASSHLLGLACDFQVIGVDADSARESIFPELERLNIRMENFPRSNWVHIDLNCTEKTPKEKRFFKP